MGFKIAFNNRENIDSFNRNLNLPSILTATSNIKNAIYGDNVNMYNDIYYLAI
jgi:hypothetical protein